MLDKDIPTLDESIVRLPTDIREDLAERGRSSLFFFNRAVMGFHDLTVDCHGPMCEFADENLSQFKLFLYPRDHLKTSNISIGATTQRVVKDVESRQLLANESATNSERFLRAIRQHAEGNRVFRALYSSVIPHDTRKVRWNDGELDFARRGHYPEPTIDTVGMTGAVTSRHYTHITYDDPISEEAVKSDKVMQDTLTRMSAALALLVEPDRDTIWLVGTRWALWDVYSEWMKLFGDRLARIVRSAVEDGQPIWPERFSLDTLALKRQMLGEYKYSCLMMNRPRNAEIQDLNVDDFKFWHWAGPQTVVLYDKAGQECDRWHLHQLDVTTTVDPAPSETINSDRNAVTTVGCSPKNQLIVLDAWAARCSPLVVLDKLFELAGRFKPRAFGIEDVAYQKSLKYFVRQEATRRGLYLNVVPVKAGKTSKVIRIRGLQPLMATGRTYIHPTQHLLRDEASEFPVGEHDDVIDSLSMHLQLFRGQMSVAARNKYKESETKLLRVLSGKARDPGVPKDHRGMPVFGKGKGVLDIEEPDDHSDQWTEIAVA